MGTRIVVMKDGFIQQISAPQNLYDNPVNLFVATFVGTPQMNTIVGTVVDEGGVTYIEFGESRIALPDSKGRKPEVLAYVGKEVILGVRPENIHDEEMYLSQYPDAIVDADVEVVEPMGNENYLYLVCEGRNFTARVSNRSTARNGDKIKVAFETSRVHLFDKDTERTITN